MVARTDRRESRGGHHDAHRRMSGAGIGHRVGAGGRRATVRARHLLPEHRARVRAVDSEGIHGEEAHARQEGRRVSRQPRRGSRVQLRNVRCRLDPALREADQGTGAPGLLRGEARDHPPLRRTGIAGSGHGFFIRVQKYRVVADGKDAGQLMGNNDNGGTQTFAKLENQIIQQTGTEGVQSG